MDKHARINSIYTITLIIMACLYIPFAESWFAGTLWGLNWQSPAFMDQVGNYLRIIKLGGIFVGITLLYRNISVIRVKFANPLVSNFFIYSSYLLALIQIPLLCLGILFNSILSSDLDYMHTEKTFKNHKYKNNTFCAT